MSGAAVGIAARPAKRLGYFFTAVGEKIIGFAGKRDRVGRFELLAARRGQRQHLHVDAGCVHVGDPRVADIGQLRENLGEPAADLLRMFLALSPGAGTKCGGREMLFERDRAHGRFSWRSFMASVAGSAAAGTDL